MIFIVARKYVIGIWRQEQKVDVSKFCVHKLVLPSAVAVHTFAMEGTYCLLLPPRKASGLF